MRTFAFRPYYLLVWACVVFVASLFGIEVVSLGIIAILGIPVVLLLCFASAARWQPEGIFRSRFAIPLALVIITSVVFTQWPLRLHFILVRPALERLAEKVERGERVNTPLQIGLFHVEAAEMESGIVYIHNSRWGGFQDFNGFVRTSPEGAKQFNLWSSVSLDPNWQYVWQD